MFRSLCGATGVRAEDASSVHLSNIIFCSLTLWPFLQIQFFARFLVASLLFAIAVGGDSDSSGKKKTKKSKTKKSKKKKKGESVTAPSPPHNFELCVEDSFLPSNFCIAFLSVYQTKRHSHLRLLRVSFLVYRMQLGRSISLPIFASLVSTCRQMTAGSGRGRAIGRSQMTLVFLRAPQNRRTTHGQANMHP